MWTLKSGSGRIGGGSSDRSDPLLATGLRVDGHSVPAFAVNHYVLEEMSISQMEQ